MLIVEGPDGAGKTTLVKQLQERYGFELSPRVVSKETEPMVDLKRWTEENLDKGFQDLLFDRHRMISHFIYAPIMGRPLGPGFDDMEWLSTSFWLFRRIQPAIIYCLPPREVVIANVAQGQDNLAVQQVTPQVYDAYHAKAALDLAMPTQRVNTWDYTTDGQEPDALDRFDGLMDVFFHRKPRN